jgi:hypothetical protein
MNDQVTSFLAKPNLKARREIPMIDGLGSTLEGEQCSELQSWRPVSLQQAAQPAGQPPL